MPGFTTRPEIRGTFGVVASTHWVASAVGMAILEKGGNAFDAAAAACAPGSGRWPPTAPGPRASAPASPRSSAP